MFFFFFLYALCCLFFFFFFSSRRRHTRWPRDWSSDVCSSDLDALPAGLVEGRSPEGAWVWRCHLDVSHPQRRAWTFLRQFVVKYDAAVFSLPAFAQRLPIPQFMISPAIDPLSDKNRDLEPGEVEAICDRL